MGEFTIKTITRRYGKADPVKEAAAWLKTVNGLRGRALVPKGVYRFKTAEEADQWMLQAMTNTRARLNSKT